MRPRHTPAWRAVLALLLGSGLLPVTAQAWSARGHVFMVQVAERLLAGSRAEREWQSRLPAGWRLADAAVWPDCLRAVQADGTSLRYQVEPGHPECRVFEDAAGRAQAERGVAALGAACGPRVPAEHCHRRLHYTDVPLHRRAWAPGESGTREHDVVAALGAAIAQLQGRPQASLRFGDEREALAWLLHLVGDLHQPLHVGALHLDAQGAVVDPDAQPRQALPTLGGNRLQAGRRNLHALWDEWPRHALPEVPDAAVLAEARALPRPGGAPVEWPRAWAAESLAQAREAYAPLHYGAAQGQPPQWSVAGDDPAARARLQRRQLIRAGARLAQLLQAIWPER